MAVTILYGNGLNRLSNAPSWDEVMTHLDPTWSSKGILSSNVPNTIQYEQIDINTKNNSLTKSLCSIFDVECDWQNEVYQDLSQRQDVNYITTNYDLTLESYFNPKPYNASSRKDGGEIIYNVHTYYYDKSANKKVWHIHGDINRPESIILGYDHYCKQISRLNDSLYPPFNYNKRGNNRGKGNDKSYNKEITWANLFFTDDIYILGLGLGFEELDLWWLLDKWARYEDKKNKIVYLDADVFNSRISVSSMLYKCNFKTVLRDFGIEYRKYLSNTWEDAYLQCLHSIP